MKNSYKALEAIEILVGSDFGLDMEWFLHHSTKKESEKKIREQLNEAAKIITRIYQIAHAETTHGCRHEDWEAIKYQIIRDYNA